MAPGVRDKAPFRLAAFVVVASMVGSGGYLIGSQWGEPVEVTSAGHDMAGMAAVADEGRELPGGLLNTNAGYTFDLDQREVPTASTTAISFAIRDADGKPVRDYDPTHERDLHLIVARRDLATFEHLHPTIDSAGVWHAVLDTRMSGSYRLFADFAAAGHDPVTLGADLQVAGAFSPIPLGSATTTDSVDGYEVALSGDLTPGGESRLSFTISRDGIPVDDLDEYLGAAGHLVALRDRDLAYLHVHPVEAESADRGPRVDFAVVAPPGSERYVLNLQFRHRGQVHTARFVVDPAVAGGEPASPPATDYSAH